ncbi:FAD/NAD(P)-binding domain-containing protein [Lophiostoma macrostomum CBS 122681]|uniref:FAD/NAD(P)-binding domain-containing protein n=1 Tax=Lophiostoma macrostomum CBS 122681 TaxID=1314788 RepID=A0A6A6T2U5_9PLEO|nr:FAD/NAD(P)-binding domain-containing protein [Lophiostoma macrostomum CBS 122681]
MNSDILIIGGGPAGLSAASSIVRQSHTTTILDSGTYRNDASHHMHTLPTWDHREPSEFRAAAIKDFERYGTVSVERATVELVKKDENKGVFEATTTDGRTFAAKKLILATGVEDVFPDIPGYSECWVSGIFHCLYCHGWEESGAESSGMLAEGDTGAVLPVLHFARQGLTISKHVTLYTNGNEQLASELKTALAAAPAPMTVDSRKITKIAKGPLRAQVGLHFSDGSEKNEAFLAHKPKFRLRGQIAEQLGCERTSMGTVKVSPPFNQTSVKGVFAAGDCANPMQTITQALFSGTAVGGGAPLQLQAEMWNQEAIF